LGVRDKANLADLTIVRSSTAQQIANGVRDLLVRGDLVPGTPLREADLATQLGVSRNTIREALRLLVAEGLLWYTVHRGVFVPELTAADVNDIYRARLAVESAGIRAVAERTADAFDPLREAVEEMRRSVLAGDWKRVGDYDLVFHSRLAAFAGSGRLDEFYRRLLAELRLRLASVDRSDEHPERWVEDHEQLLDALAAGNTELALHIATNHLSLASDTVQPKSL
jgi:DNA-binding GntR family transcriptional regulator